MNLQFAGISSAGWATSVVLKNRGVAFDMGISAEFNLGCDTVLLTHSHLDHVHALDIHILRRSMSGAQTPVRIVCAPGDYETIQDRLHLLQKDLDNAYILVAVNPGERYRLKNNLHVLPFKTSHTAPHSQGYAVYETRERLLEAFIGLSGPEIASLRRKGERVTETVVVPLVAYTGDTGPSVWRKNSQEVDFAKSCPVIITECTYFGEEETPARALSRGHTHANHLLDLLSAGVLDPKHLLLHHFSRKYRNEEAFVHFRSAFEKSRPHLIFPDENVWEFDLKV